MRGSSLSLWPRLWLCTVLHHHDRARLSAVRYLPRAHTECEASVFDLSTHSLRLEQVLVE